jgi:hypothetical protein
MITLHALSYAPLSSVERLARYVGVTTRRRLGESLGAYKLRLARCILRRRLPRQEEPSA